MTANTGSVIDHLADECVDDMGDIFSNVDANRDTGDDDCDPRAIATAAVKRALRNLFERLESQNPLRMKRKEYEGIVSELRQPWNDDALISALVRQADWTELGARNLVLLAHQYGWFFLRNATALAETLNIEDGEQGF